MTTPINTYDVTIKSVPAMSVVSLQEPVDDFATSSEVNIRLFDAIRERLSEHDLATDGLHVALYHGIPNVTELELEATIQTDAEPGDDIDVEFKILSAVGQLASLTLYGIFENYGQAMGILMRWIHDNGYQVVGAMHDV